MHVAACVGDGVNRPQMIHRVDDSARGACPRMPCLPLVIIMSARVRTRCVQSLLNNLPIGPEEILINCRSPSGTIPSRRRHLSTLTITPVDEVDSLVSARQGRSCLN